MMHLLYARHSPKLPFAISLVSYHTPRDEGLLMSSFQRQGTQGIEEGRFFNIRKW